MKHYILLLLLCFFPGFFAPGFPIDSNLNTDYFLSMLLTEGCQESNLMTLCSKAHGIPDTKHYSSRICFVEPPENLKDLPVLEVGGVLVYSTTWTSDTIYVVTDNVLVLQDITLEILAGTTVKFNQGRGINVEGGKLHILGQENDSVALLPNHQGQQNWNWQGISLSSVENADDVVVEYAILDKAVQGIRGQASKYVQVRHARIINSFFSGFTLTNCSFWELEYNTLKDNFLGIEIIASGNGNESVGNTIAHSIFSNRIINISIQGNSQGAASQNVIRDNIVKDSEHGIWLFSSSQGVGSGTHILRNVVKNNGSSNDGFGIYVSMDSVLVEENLFWKNTTAVAFTISSASKFRHNSLFENGNGLFFRSNSVDTEVIYNTFAGNKQDVARFFSWQGVLFQSNNILNNQKDSSFVTNHTPFDISIAGNFWGTTADSIIASYIQDHHNDHTLGKFIYQPVAEQAFVEAPISPPYHFISQYIDGQTRLSWNSNPEDDLAGYRIFFGTFYQYSFSDSTSLINDTLFVFPSEQNGKIAIAAYDFNANGILDLFAGHKSPYAFVQPFPYAGVDTVICAGLHAYNIKGSSIPDVFSDFYWSTSGDGYFNDPSLTEPIYFPSDNDKTNGSVVLSLNAINEDLIYTDRFVVSFALVPEVFAGEDGFVAPQSGFVLSRAQAAIATQMFWETTGDGFFVDPETLHTSYFAGSNDVVNGVVQLVLHAFSNWCDPASDTLILIVRSQFSLMGRVWKETSPAMGVPVIATMVDEPPGLPGRFITFSDANGHFRFDSLYQGNYILYAVADTTSNFWPVYYASRSRWEEAFVIELTGNTFDLDLHLTRQNQQLPEGVGGISGHFELPGFHHKDLGVYCSSWFGESRENLCDQGLSNISILLYSLSGRKVYAHTLTDANGFFYFRGLPFGTFVLEAEVAGFHSAISGQIVVSPAQQTVSNVQMKFLPDLKIDIELPHFLADQTGEAVFFPNPVVSELNIFYPGFDQIEYVFLEVLDLKGSVLIQTHQPSIGQSVKLSVHTLPAGLYVLRWSAGTQSNSFFFLRQ